MAQLPNNNISTTLVAQTIGVASHDVGTLCSHPNINVWSKRKPFETPAIDFEDNRAPVSHFGIPTRGVANVVFIPDDNWAPPQLPRGGALYPYRLADFRGYDHAARPVIMAGYAPGYKMEIPSDFPYVEVSLSIIDTTAYGGGYSLNDFYFPGEHLPLTSCYLAVYLVDAQGQTFEGNVLYATSTIANGGVSVQIPTSIIAANTQPLYATLCLAHLYKNAYIPLPHGYALTKIVNSESTLKLEIVAAPAVELQVLRIRMFPYDTYTNYLDHLNDDESMVYLSYTGELWLESQLYVASPGGQSELMVNMADIEVELDNGASYRTLKASSGNISDMNGNALSGFVTMAMNSKFMIKYDNADNFIAMGGTALEVLVKYKGVVQSSYSGILFINRD